MPDALVRRTDGLYFVALGFMVSLFLGLGTMAASPTSMLDFKAVFFGARCVSHHIDPYTTGAVVREFVREGNPVPQDLMFRRVFDGVMEWCVYPPTALVFVLPLSILPISLAEGLWILLTLLCSGCAFSLAWDLAAEINPMLSGLLIGFILANNDQVITSGNPAGIVVSFCVIATWCFVRRRLVWLGALCLALGLGIKPHDAGWILLFFLLAGREYRKRAAQSLLILFLLGGPAVLWVWHIAPHFLAEMRSNLATVALPGGLSNPNMSSEGHFSFILVVQLQSLFTFFSSEPKVWNIATYLICTPMILVWSWITIRARDSWSKTALALAALMPLAMLPIYHRPYDAKLLVLTVPACVLLWKERGKVGKIALLLSCLAFLFTADLPWFIVQLLTRNSHLESGSLAQRALAAAWAVPIPLSLLSLALFYLVIYAARSGVFRPRSIADAAASYDQQPVL